LEVQVLYDIVTHAPGETLALGRELAELLHPPCTVLLEGDLGSGKTTLTKGIIAGLGSAREEDVTSPTFTLVHEYAGNAAQPVEARRVYHVDLYRVEGTPDLESLGLDELFNPFSVVIIEWGEKLPYIPPAPVVRIRLEAVPERDLDRHIVIQRI
jgi:tRNA threonylcarbamoyladenosine biosynthesis protein TsaE